MRIYPKQFYVYMYLREDGTPYYIGKGTKKRAWSNNNRTFKRPEDESRIEIHTDNLTEAEALSLEIELIAEYGRKDNGTGILQNRTDGGEGLSGHKHSDETRNKISQANRGKKQSEATLRKLSKIRKGLLTGEKHPHFGKPKSDKTKSLLSKACPSKKSVIVKGQMFDSVSDAAKYHNVNRRTILNWCVHKDRSDCYYVN